MTGHDDEILRIRERLHKVEGTLAGVNSGQRLQREQINLLRLEQDRLRRDLDSMVKADEIALAVSTAIRRDRRQFWTAGRATVGIVAGFVVLLPSVHLAWTWFGL